MNKILIFFLTTLFAPSLNAEVVRVSSGGRTNSSVNLNGTGVPSQFRPSWFDLSIGHIDLNVRTGDVRYSGIGVQLPGRNVRVQHGVFVGINRIDYTIEIRSNPIQVFRLMDDVLAKVISSTERTALSEGVPFLRLEQIDRMATGTFTVIGPTETKSGDWAVPIRLRDTGNVFTEFDDLRRDPNGIVTHFRMRGRIELDVTPTVLFDTTVDGQPFSSQLDSGFLQVNFDQSEVIGVPEPAQFAMLGFASAGMIAINARRKRRAA